MKAIFLHLSIPLFFSLLVTFFGIDSQASIRDIFYVFFGGFFFYGAPYLMWALACVNFKFHVLNVQSGFVAISLSLGLIGSVWLGEGDPSGLPVQWLIYWPLSIFLFTVGVSVSALTLRFRKS